jgi:hypothetical protein
MQALVWIEARKQEGAELHKIGSLPNEAIMMLIFVL